MERKIGEIFEHNGEWYQCVEDSSYNGCDNCSFKGMCDYNVTGYCHSSFRNDSISVYFKKLEKVGEPYEFDGHLFQSYLTFEVPIFTENYATVREFDNNSKISIEIKQNQENMEENKMKLKPFDLEAARSGKPVCTRDGRKARIICFNVNDLYPIVALIECEDGKEIVETYSNEGQTEIYEIKGTDLMMLPEKHEGWVNVHKLVIGYETGKLYATEEEAKAVACTKCIATVKIEWEE